MISLVPNATTGGHLVSPLSGKASLASRLVVSSRGHQLRSEFRKNTSRIYSFAPYTVNKVMRNSARQRGAGTSRLFLR